MAPSRYPPNPFLFTIVYLFRNDATEDQKRRVNAFIKTQLVKYRVSKGEMHDINLLSEVASRLTELQGVKYARLEEVATRQVVVTYTKGAVWVQR